MAAEKPMSSAPSSSSDYARMPQPRDLEFGIEIEAEDTGTNRGGYSLDPVTNPPPESARELGERRSGQPELSRVVPATVPGYEILSTLGRGAMGVIYRARQTSLGRDVALKVILAGAGATEEERARFRAEALTVARLQHPNVIQVHDVGEHDGVPFLAVEYIGGGNLQDRLADRPMSVPGAVRLVYAVAHAVGAAHAKGIVHRDIKPANILMTADGVPKVADFGLIGQFGGGRPAMPGSPAYMAPEQAAGLIKRVGPASDVYSLGAILYHCLAGRPPFACESVVQTLDQIRFAEPTPLRELRPEVPEAVEAVCRKCLRKVPEERYKTAEALADDLARIIDHWEAEAIENAPAGTAGGDSARAVLMWALTGVVLLGTFAAWGTGWLTPRSKQTAPPGVSGVSHSSKVMSCRCTRRRCRPRP
jgi:serine/threonine protein kinase